MISPSLAYHRGLASGKRARTDLRQRMESTFTGWRASQPGSAHLDYAAEILKLDRDRINSPPSLTKYPETKGWPDVVMAERKGFLDGCGCGPVELAFHFSSFYFMQCRLNTRFVGSPIGTANCTAVFIRESREGGPLYGRNWDVTNVPGLDLQPPRRGPDGARRLWCKGVSCGTLCDEEPEDIFPVDIWQVMPEDCRKLRDAVEFMTRYAEFWGHCNGIVVDEHLDCVAFEKTNRRVGWRFSDDGTAAVTACAQVIPEMKAFREQCHRRSLDVRGYDEGSPDWRYWTGAEARYHRLLGLVAEAARNNPAVEDLAAIVTDHAVPYPARVCLAGETCHPSLDSQHAEWTMRSRAAVLHGPNRRTLFYRVEEQKACYDNPPFLVLGEGVEMKSEWEKGVRFPPAASGPDDEMERYRQFEFDFPNYYPR
jgi:hypothetical protein